MKLNCVNFFSRFFLSAAAPFHRALADGCRSKPPLPFLVLPYFAKKPPSSSAVGRFKSISSFSEEEEDPTENDFNHACRNASSGVSLSSGSHSKHFCKNCANFIEHPRPSAFLRPSAASLRREAFSRAVSKGKNKEDYPEDGAAGAVVFEVVVSKSSSSSSRC